MGIMFGNSDLEQIVKKKYLKKVKDFLKNNGYKKIDKCDDVENEIGNYHIYDMPRIMMICGEKKMQDFISFLKKEDLINKGFIGKVGLSYYNKKSN